MGAGITTVSRASLYRMEIIAIKIAKDKSASGNTRTKCSCIAASCSHQLPAVHAKQQHEVISCQLFA